MTMQVETFEEGQEESAEFAGCDEEAIALAQELGLVGQERFSGQAKEVGGEKRLSPYRSITIEERFVYRTLLEETTEASKYSQSPIPIRVLQVLAHATGLGCYQKFEIWSQRTAIKDPVLVGVPAGESQYTDKRDLLARWGEVLEPIETLKLKAIKLAGTAKRVRVEKAIAECSAILTALKSGDPSTVEAALSQTVWV
jgi:hypothetical protein